jgi:hypothetical protein
VRSVDDVDVWAGVQRAARDPDFGSTDQELLMIKENPQWRDRLVFAEGGEIVKDSPR